MAEAEATTLIEILRTTRLSLSAAGIEDAALESRLIVEHFTGTTRAHTITAPKRPVEAAAAALIAEAAARRAEGEPVHRILGRREFYGLDLALSPETLEPRPDTETLVDAVLPLMRETARYEGACRILDLGTGTGAIALALLSQIETAEAVATDISQDALATAAHNAAELGLSARFAPLQSDWFSKVEGRFHWIVSNPPYIRTREIEGLPVEVRNFDPRRALDGGVDGLDAYRNIASGARDHLAGSGRIAIEIGYDQREAVIDLFQRSGFECIKAVRDLAENDRALVFASR